MFTLCPETTTAVPGLWFSVIVNSVYGYTSALRAPGLPEAELVQRAGLVRLRGVCVLRAVVKLEPWASLKAVMGLGAARSRAGQPQLHTRSLLSQKLFPFCLTPRCLSLKGADVISWV